MVRLQKSLGTKFLFFSFLSILLPIILINLFSYYTSQRALIKTIVADNIRFALRSASEIRTDVLALKNILETTGTNLSVVRDLGKKREILIALDTRSIPIKSLAILNKEGKEIIRSDDKLLEDKSNYPEFYITIKEGYYFSEVRFDREKEKSYLTIANPLLEDFKFAGVLVTEIDLYTIWERVRMMTLGQNDSTYLFTKRGQLVARAIPSNQPFQIELEGVALTSAMAGGITTQEILTKAGRMLKITTSIPGLDWQMTIFKPLAEIYKEIDFVRNEILIITLITLGLVSLIVVLFSRSIINPIHQLHKGAEIIGQGNLDYRVNIRAGDEIEQLGREFNRMAERLKQSKGALEESKTALEIKIEARTKELQELAAGLEGKVKERTKELQLKIDELEKFQRLTIGREVAMVELKKEIKKIKEELKKTNPAHKDVMCGVKVGNKINMK